MVMQQVLISDCLPKAELKTKNSTKRQLCCRLVEFLVFNSIHQKKTCSLSRDLPLTPANMYSRMGVGHRQFFKRYLVFLPIKKYIAKCTFTNKKILVIGYWLILTIIAKCNIGIFFKNQNYCQMYSFLTPRKLKYLSKATLGICFFICQQRASHQ